MRRGWVGIGLAVLLAASIGARLLAGDEAPSSPAARGSAPVAPLTPALSPDWKPGSEAEAALAAELLGTSFAADLALERSAARTPIGVELDPFAAPSIALTPQPIPEPGAASLVLFGLALLARLARRRAACHPPR